MDSPTVRCGLFITSSQMEEIKVPLTVDLQASAILLKISVILVIQKQSGISKLLVLSTLKWGMQACTPFSFIDYFLRKINSDLFPSRSLINRTILLILNTIKGLFFPHFVKVSIFGFLLSIFRAARSGNRPMKRLFMLISLNVAYSTSELFIGIVSGRIGKSLTESTLMGKKRLEVLSAFTNALFLLFMSFSLAVEALHAFIQDESEHKHYLIISAITNLLVNLIGVWFFRNYARVNLVYRKAEDMNYHSVCLHVLADSIRSAGVILASWLLALGVENAEVLCLGLVSVTVFMLVMPLFRASGGVLLQMAPPSIPSSALSKCLRQVNSREDVLEVSQARFWELVPGHVVGSLSLQVKKGMDEHAILEYVHHLYHDLGVQNLTVQTDFA